MSRQDLLWDRLFAYVNEGLPDHAELTWQYCGLDIWPIVKSQILMRGSNTFNAGRASAVSRKRTGLRAIAWQIRLIPYRVKRAAIETAQALRRGPRGGEGWPAECERAEVLCFGNATNHKQLGPGYFQLCLDPVRLALAESGHSSVCLVPGLAADEDRIVHAALNDTFGLGDQLFRARRASSRLPRVDLMAFPGFRSFWDGLGKIVGSQSIVTIEQLETTVRETAACAKWLHRHLSRTRPRLVLVTAYYGLVGHGASWACRELGIPIADVQHGVAGGAHHAYSWPNAPRRGFNTLPTGFLTWSEAECADMRRVGGNWLPRLLPAGNAWWLFEEMLLRASADQPIFAPSAFAGARDELRENAAAISRLKAGRPEGKDILVALHPEERIGWFEELRRIAPQDWRFWLRVHPGDTGNVQLLGLADQRTFVAEATRMPLNVLLNAVDVLLTKYSSVILDAHAFGVPAVAYSQAARAIYGGSGATIAYTSVSVAEMKEALTASLAIRSGNARAPVSFANLGRSVFESLCEPEAVASNGA